MENQKIWIESRSDEINKVHFGMSSGLGATVADLPTVNVPQGSDAFDYTTSKLYFWDGLSWNEGGR